MLNRKERRAAAHKALKLARHGGSVAPLEQPPPPPPTTTAPPASAPAPVKAPPIANVAITGIPEPGAPFPALSSLTAPANQNPSAPPPINDPRDPISPARLAANRANSQHSTGPKSASGLANSSQNHTTHGLARHNGAFALLASESAAGFEALKQSLAAEHQPGTETESIFVTTMAESHWLANRAQNLQSSCFDQQTGQIIDAKMFSLYLRYQTTHTRAFHKGLNDLLKLRAETHKAERGFEAQTRQQADLAIKNEKHEMKKQTHYWDVLRKDAEACYRISQNVVQNRKAAEEHPGFEAQYAAELAKHGLQPDLYGSAKATAA